MVQTNAKESHGTRREALLTSLPFVLFGLAIGLSALIYGGGPWHKTPTWRTTLSVLAWFVPAAAVGIGGCIAVIRRLPTWSYTWLGASVMEVFLLVTIIEDELAESGQNIISPTAEAIIAVALLVAILAALAVAALRGWQQAGLVSVGLASTMGLATLGMVMAAPFYRWQSAILAIPLGLIMAALTWTYVRSVRVTVRVAVLFCLALLNAGPIWALGSAVREWMIAHGQSPFTMQLMVLSTALFLAGPVLGLLSRPLQPLLRRT